MTEREAIRTLLINVPGVPRPQPRARHVAAGRGKVRVVSTADDHAKLWQEAVEGAVKRALADVGPGWLPRKGEALEASLVFRMPGGERVERKPAKRELVIEDIVELYDDVPAGNAGLTIELCVVPVDRYHVTKPDADNLAKLAMDILTKAGGLGTLDDCALARVEVVKLRAS